MSEVGVRAGQFTGRTWELGSATVRTLDRKDMSTLRVWRNEQQHVLRQQSPIDEEHQARWYENVVVPSYAVEQPAQLLFLVTRDNNPTSYGGLTNIEWTSSRAEISFLAATAVSHDQDRYAHEFTGFLQWLQRLGFGEVGLHRLFTETWAFRHEHIRLLEANGMKPEGRLREHVVKNGERHDAVLHGLLRNEWVTS